MTSRIAEMEMIAIAMFSSATTRHGWEMLTPRERRSWREKAKKMLIEASADFQSPFPDGYCVLKNPEGKTSFTGYDAGVKARRESGIGKRSHKAPILIGIPLDIENISPSFFLGLVEMTVLRVGITKAKEILVFDTNAAVLESISRCWRRVQESVSEELYHVTVHNVGESDAGYTTHMQIRDEEGRVTDDVDCGDFDSPEDAEHSVIERGGRIVKSIWDEQGADEA